MIDDFEVAVFLTETSSRHAILKKDKRAKIEKPRLGTSKGRLTGAGTQAAPVEVEGGDDVPMIREESQENADMTLENIPPARDSPSGGRAQATTQGQDVSLFVSEGSDDEGFQTQKDPPSRKVRKESALLGQEDKEDDKKKMALNTTYDGFTIYGRILCLVVKRRGNARGKEQSGGSGQAMMEEWIASTQAGEEHLLDD